MTTGPAHGSILQSQPFLANLEAEGLLTLCDTGLGIACDTRSVAISTKGKAVEGLFIAGPLARGTFGELMGLPQVTEMPSWSPKAFSRIWRCNKTTNPHP